MPFFNQWGPGIYWPRMVRSTKFMVGRRLEKKQIILATLQLKLIDNPYYILLITYHQSSIMIARNNYLSFIIDYSSLIKESPNHGFQIYISFYIVIQCSIISEDILFLICFTTPDPERPWNTPHPYPSLPRKPPINSIRFSILDYYDFNETK